MFFFGDGNLSCINTGTGKGIGTGTENGNFWKFKSGFGVKIFLNI